MNSKLSTWLKRYGIFIIAMGITGFLSNPQKAATALMSGGTFGVLSILWGVLMVRGVRWSRLAACATTLFLVLVFAWRSSVSWKAFMGGAADKLTAAIFITMMGTASIAMLVLLLSSFSRKTQPASE
jgi:hypothetical protein